MAFQIEPGLPLDAEIRRIAGEQLGKAAAELSGGGDRHEAIHDVRKRFKKLRALFRLVRGADEALFRAENARLRDAARVLSASRDRTALIESLSALEKHVAHEVATDAFEPVHAALAARRDAALEAEGDLDVTIAATLAVIGECRDALDGLAFPRPVKRAPGLLAEGVARSQRQARRALGLAVKSGDAEAFHELRKSAKDHAAHCGLLAPLWPEAMKVARAAAAGAGDDLGLDHDYAVFRAELGVDPDAFGPREARDVVLGLMDRRQFALRASALAGARRLFSETPKAAAARIERLARDAAKAAPKTGKAGSADAGDAEPPREENLAA